MAFAALLFLLIFASLAFGGSKESVFGGNAYGMAIGLVIFGLLAFFSAFLAIRLWLGSLSANGVSVMPTWFIQTFGVFMLIGMGFATYQQRSLPMLGGLSIWIGAIFFGGIVAKRKREQSPKQ